MRIKLIWLTVALTLLVVFIGGFFVYKYLTKPTIVETPAVVEETPTPEIKTGPKYAVIGSSVERRNIETFTFGESDGGLLFVGGVHGGYEWNSTYLAYRMLDHLEANPGLLPEGVGVTIIPTLNPDGLFAVTGKEGRFTVDDVPDTTPPGEARFNANQVDLNRNFDCKWQPESSWKGNTVSAGSAAFSEPEAAALRDYVLTHKPKAVVFWHSQANAVYASECEAGILAGTREIMDAYGNAAGYKKVDVFDAYPVTGDAEGWLASIGIPAITVELSSHLTIDWDKNLAGTMAVVNSYGEGGLAR
jgi:predicted deacylase